jgi:hypothetical protein
MLTGILRVFAKTRPALAARSREIAILDHQVRRIRAELAAIDARLAIERGDAREAARQLAVVRNYRGGWMLAAAQRLLDYVPSAALTAFRVRQRLRGV